MKVSIGFSCWLLTLAILKDILVAGLPLSFSNRPTRFKYWVSFDSISILGQLKSTTNYRPLIGPQTWIWEFMGLLGTLSQHLQFLQYLFSFVLRLSKTFLFQPFNWLIFYCLLSPTSPTNTQQSNANGRNHFRHWRKSQVVLTPFHSSGASSSFHFQERPLQWSCSCHLFALIKK